MRDVSVYAKIYGMKDLPEPVIRAAERPKYAGKCADESSSGISASFVCGAGIRFSLRVDPETRSILDARYQTNACAFAIASAETITSEEVGSKLTQLHGTRSLETKIKHVLSICKPERQHCYEIAVEAFRSALADYRSRTIEEFRGEKALICTCFGVTEEAVVGVIEAGASEVSEVSAACNAGLGCGSCKMVIRELLDAREHDSAAKIML